MLIFIEGDVMEDFIKGVDLSTLTEVENCGGHFYHHGKLGDAVEILQEYGINMVRLRLFHNPFSEDGRPYGAGGCDLETVAGLAKRVMGKGLDWMLNLHYSDCWADPGKQTVPKAWQGMGGKQLEEAVYQYTKEVLGRFRREGILPAIAAIGNELSSGLLWPYGKVPNYSQIARFIGAGICAAHEVSPEIKIMVHLDNGGNNHLYRTWFDAYFENGGEDFDYIGLSYYPFWHGTMEMLQNNMNDIALRYHKKLIITEVSTAFTAEDYAEYEKLPDRERKGMATKPPLMENLQFEASPEGQKAFMERLGEVIRQVPGHACRGFLYWEAAWLPVPGSQWATAAALEYMGEKGPGGNEWANQALFDYDGNALPALEVIRDMEIL